MNSYNVRGYLIEVSGKLKQILARITMNESLYGEGLEEEFLGNVQKKLGRPEKEIRRLIERPFQEIS